MFSKQNPSTITFSFTIILLLHSFVFSYQSICNPQDHSSLLSFSANISTSSFPRLNWSSTTSCCRWEGVDCNSNGRVTRLRLPSRGLEGKLVSSIRNLTSLIHLDLSDNLFYGVLPKDFSELMSNMEIINLSSNRLSGDFSLAFSLNGGFPSKINTVDISNNQLCGEIKTSWFVEAKSLTNLNFSNNSFSGSFPSSICSNSLFLKTLDLSHNNFNGSLPNSIGECLYLTNFRVGFNYFYGSIPNSIYDLKELTEMSMTSNDLRGSIGKEIVRLTNLKTLDLSSNNIFGHIPQEIGNLSFLENLYLHSNNISGPIPQSFMNCTNLREMILRDNHLGESLSTLDFSRLVQLRKFDIRNNSFTGTLPYSCKSLTAIRVFQNNLTGQISPKIVELKSLSFFSITLNSFTNVTKSLKLLANCKSLTSLFLGWNFHDEFLPSDKSFLNPHAFPKLQYFSLDGCNLTGSFPQWLSNIKTLRVVQLDRNKLTGNIPNWIGDLPNLFSLSLANNNFYGEIPHELCHLPTLVSKIVDSKLNQFHFELSIFHPTSNGGYNQYTTIPSTLILSNNTLSGQIPWEIGKLQSLQQLDIGNNFFWGHIPISISNLTNLEALDLSRNNLSGDIPTSLQNLHFLSKFNVSYNDLEGALPTSGQFATFEESSFEGNPGLCGELLHRSCSNPWRLGLEDQNLNNGNNKKQMFLEGLFVGLGSGFSGVLVIVASYVLYINYIQTSLIRTTQLKKLTLSS